MLANSRLPEMGFNPTLVRLRPDNLTEALQRQSQFQSHAGSIEARSGHRRSWGHHSFQSHAGSIEAQFPNTSMFPIRVFQSHAGSIEAPLWMASSTMACIVSIPRWFD